MALNAVLKQLIETNLAHTHEPQWALPITEIRQAFRNLWTPAITGELVSIPRIEDVTILGVDTPIPTRVYAPDRQEPCPIMLYFKVLLQPVVDFTLSFPSVAMPSTECLVPRQDLAWYYQTYRGDQCDPRDPRVSPIYAQDLSGLPPALIIAAEYDTLRDEAAAYAERLKTAGVATRYTCADGMVHGFLQMRGIVPDAQIATEEIARALN